MECPALLCTLETKALSFQRSLALLALAEVPQVSLQHWAGFFLLHVVFSLTVVLDCAGDFSLHSGI